MDKWKVLSEKRILETDHRLRVFSQRVQLPSGSVVDDYYQISIPDFTTIYAETISGMVLCLYQYKHGMQRAALTLPGGQIDIGETPLHAAKRELLEETGYECSHWRPLEQSVVNGNQRIATAHMFYASGGRKISDPNSGDLEEMESTLLVPTTVTARAHRGEFPILSHLTTILLTNQMRDSNTGF